MFLSSCLSEFILLADVRVELLEECVPLLCGLTDVDVITDITCNSGGCDKTYQRDHTHNNIVACDHGSDAKYKTEGCNDDSKDQYGCFLLLLFLAQDIKCLRDLFFLIFLLAQSAFKLDADAVNRDLDYLYANYLR